MSGEARSSVALDCEPRTDFVIQARGVAKRYRGGRSEVRALNGVDIDVRRGEMLVLLGPSGCGKTTLLRCIGGLENPDAGDINLCGRVVTSVRRRINVLPEQRNLGMMFQSYGLWPHMSVHGNIAYPLGNQPGVARGEINARVAAMLDKMGLSALGDRYPGQLSGGQQQRVALARALVASPTALLFDEPLSNVDAQVRKRLREEIRQIKDDHGIAGVYVTHDQEEAMALADILAVMQDGLIRQIGSPWEIYRRPTSLYVAQFIGEANALPARAVGVEKMMARCETEIGDLALAIEGGAPPLGAGHIIARPEDAVLLDGDTPQRADANIVQGAIASKILLGPSIELKVNVGAAQLRVCVNSASHRRFAPGDAVSLWLPPESLVWIPV